MPRGRRGGQRRRQVRWRRTCFGRSFLNLASLPLALTSLQDGGTVRCGVVASCRAPPGARPRGPGRRSRRPAQLPAGDRRAGVGQQLGRGVEGTEPLGLRGTVLSAGGFVTGSASAVRPAAGRRSRPSSGGWAFVLLDFLVIM